VSWPGFWQTEFYAPSHAPALERGAEQLARGDLDARDFTAVLRRRVPGYEAVYERRRWRMLDGIEVFVAGKRGDPVAPCGTMLSELSFRDKQVA
jgi:hypothetical protein